jgi:O-antigen/teichoic acid export membrane protein
MAIAPQFVFTYAAMILSIGLIILDKQWKATQNAMVSLALTPLLILALVPLGERLGEGGAAAGAALAVVVSEIFISILCLRAMGHRAVDRRTLTAALKSLAVCIAVVAMHTTLSRFGGAPDPRAGTVGPGLILLDAVAYVVVALAIRVVRPAEVVALLRLLRSHKTAAT